MRGRHLFKIIKPCLAVYCGILKLLPFSFALWLFTSLRYTRGLIGFGLRYGLLKRLAKECGDNVGVNDSAFLRYPELLKLGSNISIHSLCYIDAQGEIEIGNDVSIAHNVSILSFEHDFSDVNKPIKDAPCIGKKIVIENDIWIGAGVRILGGVTIGTGSIIGAGAVVTKDIPPKSVAVGVPARVIRTRTSKN